MNPTSSSPAMPSRLAGPILLPSNPKLPSRRRPTPRLPTGAAEDKVPQALARRASLTSGGPKPQRTSKTSQKLVVLPSAPQTKPLLTEADEDLTLGYETDAGVREYKSQAERMTKEQREEAGFKRLTAYCVAESFRTKLLASFLKREHNVSPRVFDEALYVVYHLPLLPGYGPDTNVRSSAPSRAMPGKSFLSHLSEAEEDGYQGTYFTSPGARSPSSLREGYISSSSPVDTRKAHQPPSPTTPTSPMPLGSHETEPFIPESENETAHQSENEREADLERQEESAVPASTSDNEGPPERQIRWQSPPRMPSRVRQSAEIAEVVFFDYGVVVFFGLLERQERDILEDIERAGVFKRPIEEAKWEIEECHFTHDPHIAYPRIYNDFFTLKSRSHLLKLSIAHALAQSTLLAHYETNAQYVLSSPLALSIPQQLAASGGLQLRRRDALKLTGRLFKLRRDVNLVSNVLDVPELFWSEASLGELYEAVREYMEIKGRVQVLNEKLGVASDFLDAIHDHLNNNEMTRITWIVIWLIIIAVVVDLGEIVARLVLHETIRGPGTISKVISREDALRTLERMMVQSS
ncbi:Sporulation protein RMD8 [Hypsizygus marmoreus]|uniref:Sporulation protein RMD8 n=1 Tax=Hypsizygus marmoreus TaxID=39966 RepID=A0A369KG17_HYPMA|nr:Sporulation protein RMD8 [Hypsizygus marmoreus]